jgi:predicted GH43/DUF377 family glycosyl hydrolase
MAIFNWIKLGRIFDPTEMGSQAWMVEQAQNPYALALDDCVRIYFNTRGARDSSGKSVSLPGYVDLDKSDLFKIRKISETPLIKTGGLGEFDEFGVMAGSVIKTADEYRLFYVGWTRMVSVPYNWAIGLATSNDGKTFTKFGRGPIIGATPSEPYLQAGCSSVIHQDGRYHMWYTSGIKWIDSEKKAESVYRVMHATSTDAKVWDRDGEPVIPPIIIDEAQASPSVFYYKNQWHMVFSYRHSVNFRNSERGYRLGYAFSNDLQAWQRDDTRLGFDTSESGWDSEMICYPNILKMDNKLMLFYCGNDFGRRGFGVAISEIK